MVPQEEQRRAYCSSSGVLVCRDGSAGVAAAGSGGGGIGRQRPSKQPKQKKIPQRGLGVAQLERIRLEEQQRSVAATTYAASSPSFTFSPGSAIPLPPVPRGAAPFSGSSDLNSSGIPSIPIPCNPFPDLPVPVPPLPPHASMMASHARSTGHEFLPIPWNSFEISPRKVKAGDKALSIPIPPQNDPSSRNASPSPCDPQSHQQQWQQEQRLPSSSVWVNSSVSPLFSGVRLPMEPPSNQTSVNNPETPEDSKMVGVKRPWPFPFDGPPPGLPCKVPFLTAPFNRAEEHPSTIGDDMLKWKLAATNPSFAAAAAAVCLIREGPPCSGASQVDWRSLFDPLREKSSREGDDGGFLTLGSSLPAPPVWVPPAVRSKFKQPRVPRASHQCGSSEPGSAPCHGGGDDAISRFGCPSQSSDQLPFYSFIPTRPSSQETTFREHRREAVDNLDLSLKL